MLHLQSVRSADRVDAAERNYETVRQEASGRIAELEAEILGLRARLAARIDEVLRERDRLEHAVSVAVDELSSRDALLEYVRDRLLDLILRATRDLFANDVEKGDLSVLVAAIECELAGGSAAWQSTLGANLAIAGALKRSFHLGVLCADGLSPQGGQLEDNERPWRPGCGRSVLP
jgi:hypothetical protein